MLFLLWIQSKTPAAGFLGGPSNNNTEGPVLWLPSREIPGSCLDAPRKKERVWEHKSTPSWFGTRETRLLLCPTHCVPSSFPLKATGR